MKPFLEDPFAPPAGPLVADVDPETEAAALAGATPPDGEAEARTVKPFPLWAPSQFLAYAPDPSACLLGAGYLERGEWTSLVGIGGLGKTRLALWLVVCQLTGREWCGLPTAGEPQRTIFLSGENGVRRWKTDLEKIFATLTEAEAARVEANLRVMALTADDDGDLCLGNPDTRARLIATLKERQAGIVVLDPFADLVDGDENKTPDVVMTLRHLRTITRSACPAAAVLIIHHARTGAANVAQAGDLYSAGNFGRGSKALYSRVRCELQLAPAARGDPNRLVLSCGKANNCEKFSTRGLVFDPETFTYDVDESFDFDAWRNDVAGKRTEPSVSVAEVVAVVRELAPVTGNETTSKAVHDALAHTGATLRTVQRRLGAALEAGYVREGKSRGKWKLGAKPLKA